MIKFYREITDWHSDLRFRQLLTLAIKTLLFGYCYCIIAIAFWLIFTALSGINFNDVSSRTDQFDITKASFIFMMIGVVLSEELTFRLGPVLITWMTLESTKKTQSKKTINTAYLLVIIISSGIFGLLHGGLIHIIFQGVLGFIWGILFIRIFTAKGPMIALGTTFAIHMVWNSILYLLLLMNSFTRV